MTKAVVIVSPYYSSIQKRLLDVIFSVLVIVLTWPLMIIVAAAILFDSGWPIIFAQKRTGQYKKIFLLYKFRTMKIHTSASKKALYAQNQAPYPMFKMAHDPRYTKIGKFLSRTGIDELLQVINILKGEMSWVGPRPLPVEESHLLPKEWNFRYRIKPGIISEWAVSSERYFSLEKWRKLEIETIEQGNFKNDLLLMKKTLQYIFRI